MKRALIFVLFTSTACQTTLVSAPHRSRESDLGPAAAEGRYGSVMERASTFEKQNLKSRDVYWYRVWRAGAMIGLGQVDEGEKLLDEVLSEISAPEVNPAEIGRLRMFAFDLKARAAIAKQQPAPALGYLDRAMSLALDLKPDTGSKCDYDLMIAARQKQIVEVSAMAGDQDRMTRTQNLLDRRLEDWALCLARKDFPAMQALSVLKGNVGAVPAAALAAAPAAPAQATPAPVAAAPAAPAPAPATPAPVAVAPQPVASAAPAGLGIQVSSVRYGPIDASPYKTSMENAVRLVERQHKGVQADTMIRVDGSRRALRLRVPMKKLDSAHDLVPIFKNTVVFFEQTRDVQPKIDEVLIAAETPGGTTQVVAQRSDIFDLFVDRIDVASFTKRLVEVR